jgi:hypothetical protein
MEWSEVRIFLAVARGRSLGGAARHLGVSHPTVGRRMKALEDEAGRALCRKTKEGLVLTDAADAVVALAESMGNSALFMEGDWPATTSASPDLEDIFRRMVCWLCTGAHPGRIDAPPSGSGARGNRQPPTSRLVTS